MSAAIVIFAVAAVGNGFDRVSREAFGIERVVPRPFRAQADRSAAVIALSRREFTIATEQARAAVLHDPVDRDSTALLGSALLFGNDEAGAEAAFRVAARFGWRNVATQLYWFQAALEAADYDLATDRADAILRAHPAYSQRNALLAPLESDPRGRAALARHLRQSPEWLPYYLDVASDVPPDLVERRLDVLAMATTGTFHFDCNSLSTPVFRLIRVGRYEAARKIWNANCPLAATPSGIVDPNFAFLAANTASPFGWQPYLAGDLSMSFEGEGRDRRLVLDNGAPIGHVALQQPIALPPGKYRVLIDGNAAAVNSAALSWTCDDGPSGQLTTGPLARNGELMKVMSCSRQLLGLWLPAHASGMSFRQVQLLPVSSVAGG